jgi:hypothetical protein
MKNFYPALVSFLFSLTSLKAQYSSNDYYYEAFHGPVKSIEQIGYADSVDGEFNGRVRFSFDTLGQVTLYEQFKDISGNVKQHYNIPLYVKEYQNPLKKHVNSMVGELEFSNQVHKNPTELKLQSMITFQYKYHKNNRLLNTIIHTSVHSGTIIFVRHDYRGDSIIISQEKLTDTKEFQSEPIHSVFVKKGNLLLSSGTYINDSPIYYGEYTYEAFDQWQNWTKRRFKYHETWKGEQFAGEIVQQRNILYYE